MSAGGQLTVEQHEVRAKAHLEVAEALIEADQEWAVVPLFYSAYHLVKASMLVDPVFDDPSQLVRYSPSLTMADRYTETHKGRVGPAGTRDRWGVSDIVALMYKPIYADYNSLHNASVSVRYKRGLVVGTPEEAAEALDRLAAQYRRAEIRAPFLAARGT